MTISDMNTTPEEDHILDTWLPYLSDEQYAELCDDAWEIGADEAYAQEAYDTVLPVLAQIIERNLRENA